MTENPSLFFSGANGAATYITLRDLFAGMAMMGLNADPSYDLSSSVTAKSAYADSDAMLAEREKGEK